MLNNVKIESYAVCKEVGVLETSGRKLFCFSWEHLGDDVFYVTYDDLIKQSAKQGSTPVSDDELEEAVMLLHKTMSTETKNVFLIQEPNCLFIDQVPVHRVEHMTSSKVLYSRFLSLSCNKKTIFALVSK